MVPQSNPLSMLNALKSNPAAFLGQRLGVQLPQGITHPQQIIDFLVRNGRVTQAQINQAYQMSRQYFPSSAQRGTIEYKPKGI